MTAAAETKAKAEPKEQESQPEPDENVHPKQALPDQIESSIPNDAKNAAAGHAIQ